MGDEVANRLANLMEGLGAALLFLVPIAAFAPFFGPWNAVLTWGAAIGSGIGLLLVVAGDKLSRPW